MFVVEVRAISKFPKVIAEKVAVIVCPLRVELSSTGFTNSLEL